MIAGAAERDITPLEPEGMLMGGFGFNRRATGVLHPMMLQALYLRDDDGSAVCIVSIDCVGIMSTNVARITAAVADIIPADRVLVCATHTHASPDTIGFWGKTLLGVFPIRSGVDPVYMKLIVDRAVAAIRLAHGRASEAVLRSATFNVDAKWSRNDRKDGGRYDRGVALAVERCDDGSRIATLLNFASHPETLWEDNTLLSPDYPATYRSHMVEQAGGVAVFVSGPLGAMLTPNVDAKASDPERQSYADALGVALAEHTIQALDGVHADATAQAVTFRSEPIRLKNENWRYHLLQKLGVVRLSSADEGSKSVRSQCTGTRIGDLTLVSVPGELAPELGDRIYDAMPGQHRMMLGLCGDEFGYILEPRMFDDAEYKYECTMSLGRETGPVIFEACKRAVNS